MSEASTQSSTGRDLIFLIVAIVMVAAVAAAGWWMARPHTRTDVELESSGTTQNDYVQQTQSTLDQLEGIGVESSPQPITEDAQLETVEGLRVQAERLASSGESVQAINLIRDWLARYGARDVRSKTQAIIILATHLKNAGRLDEAEVYFVTAVGYGESLGVSGRDLTDYAKKQLALLTESELQNAQDYLSPAQTDDNDNQANRAQPGYAKPARDENGVWVITVPLSRDFAPSRDAGKAGLGASWLPRMHRLEDGPAFAVKEPVYRNESQLYGLLPLGNRAKGPFIFVMDVPTNGAPLLWFDGNRNNDLTDDGEPLANQGSGLFAAEVSVELREVLPELGQSGDFQIWFFTNQSLWAQRWMSHYARTTLKGRVNLDGVFHTAYIVDSARNEGDFTNDGIAIDLNDDEKIGTDERVAMNNVLNFNGEYYRFDVRW